MDNNEAHIIRRILGGETALFEHFLRTYGEQVFHLVFRITGNREDAEELTQDVFLKAFRQLSSFRGKSSVSTWLYSIAYNTAITYARKQDFSVAVMDERELSILSDTVIDEALDDENEDRIRQLRRAIRQLDAEEQALVTLFYEDEKSLHDISRITGLTEGNLRVKLHRIRKKLYLLIKKEEEKEI